MRLLSLLAHGKHGGVNATSSDNTSSSTMAARALCPHSDGGGGDDGLDDGPFFDFEFAVPLRDLEEDRPSREKQRLSSDVETDDADADDDDDGDEFDLTMSPDGGRYDFVGGSLPRDPVVSFSPSDDLFFKGRPVPLEHSSLSDFAASEPRPSKPQVPAFLLKSAARFRVFRMGFHLKTKSASLQSDPAATLASPKKQPHSKLFVKFKAEEAPLAALFARDNSTRSSCSSRSTQLYADYGLPAADARRLPKDVLHRYISKIKPFYVRISKRYGEKLPFSGPLGSAGARKVRPAWEGGETGREDNPKEPPPAAATFKGSAKSQGGNIPAGLRVVCRRLRKSRSASAAVSSMQSPPLATGRRDDSLLEQQDGIQSAIAHCKRCFNRGSESPLTRSRSDPGDGRSTELSSSSV